MALKKFLPLSCSYTPSDLFKTSSDTIVCDLNNKISIDLNYYDTVVFSGVLEYVYNIENLFAQLAVSTPHVVLSYACSDISNAARLKKGWLSDYSQKDLERIFKKYQYDIMEYKEWRKQSLYSLIKR